MHPIRLRGARTHNLQDVRPRPRARASSSRSPGPSGAGKSSLALDTLYAEGQRRFVESFSPYARQFLERLERPPIDSLDPIAATVAVDRRAPVKSSRSTLATMADLEPYLAALFAREAVPDVPGLRRRGDRDDRARRGRRARSRRSTGARAIVSYPVRVARRGGATSSSARRSSKDGYRRLVVGGERARHRRRAAERGAAPDVARRGRRRSRRSSAPRDVAAAPAGDRDRRGSAAADAPSSARRRGADGARTSPIARGLVCPTCARAFEPPRAGLFSYNSPLGACADVPRLRAHHRRRLGQGHPRRDETLDREGAIKAWAGKSSEWERERAREVREEAKASRSTCRGAKLTDEQRSRVIDGEGDVEAAGSTRASRAWFKWLETRTYKMHVRVFLARYREYVAVRRRAAARASTRRRARTASAGSTSPSGTRSTVARRARALDALAPRDAQGERVQSELASRLALPRRGRARLPHARSAGAHALGRRGAARGPHDGARRVAHRRALRARRADRRPAPDATSRALVARDARARRARATPCSSSSTTERSCAACDRVVELGPGAGAHGGRVLFDGTPAELAERERSPDRRARWAQRAAARANAATADAAALEIARRAREQPRERRRRRSRSASSCAITGPSGSGKSTLVEDVALPRRRARARRHARPTRRARTTRSTGRERSARAVLVDQSPLGRTARGNAATYTKAWDRIRARFAAEPEAVRAGSRPGIFSFNVAERGRCEACSGEGYETVEMQFLADVRSSARRARASASRPRCSRSSTTARASPTCSR